MFQCLLVCTARAVTLSTGIELPDGRRQPIGRLTSWSPGWIRKSTRSGVRAAAGGAIEMVLGWEKMRTRSPRVIGFSDISILLNALVREKVGCPISGPTWSHLPAIDELICRKPLKK